MHDAGASRADIGAYEYLVREERFPMRAHVMVAGNDAEAMEWWLQQGPQYDYWVTIGFTAQPKAAVQNPLGRAET